MSVPVILDTDIGSDIDDVYALVFAMNHPEIELVGVTTVGSFPHARARLAAKFLRLGGREDIGVYTGNAAAGPQQADAPPLPPKGDNRNYTNLVGPDDPEHGRYYPDAVDFILKTLDTAIDPVTIVGIGGWTNVAEVLRRATPHQLARIGLVAMMGAEVHRMRRESNAVFDPAATRTVLTSEVPTFVATWSISRKLAYTMDEIDTLMDRERSPLMSEVYRGTKQWFNPKGLKAGPVCYDLVPLLWAAGDREAFTCIKLASIPVESHGMFTTGMTFCEPWTLERAETTHETSSEYNTVTHELDENALKDRVNDILFGRR